MLVNIPILLLLVGQHPKFPTLLLLPGIHPVSLSTVAARHTSG